MTGFRVTLLGTGVPIPRPDRFGPSTLIEAGDQTLLIDAGLGATMRLFQLGVPIFLRADLRRCAGRRIIARDVVSKSGGRSRAQTRFDAAIIRTSLQAVDRFRRISSV